MNSRLNQMDWASVESSHESWLGACRYLTRRNRCGRLIARLAATAATTTGAALIVPAP